MKVYLAVLEGFLEPSKWPSKLVPDSSLHGEDSDNIDPGHNSIVSPSCSKMPSVSIPSERQPEWQDVAMKQQLGKCLEFLKLYSESEPVLSEGYTSDIDPEILEFNSYSTDTFEKSAKLRKRLRKYLKRKGAPIAEQEVPVEISKTQEVTIPEVNYRSIRMANSTSDQQYVHYDTATNRLVIEYPVAEVSGDFRMEIGHTFNPGRPCTTYLEVVSYGSYQVSYRVVAC